MLYYARKVSNSGRHWRFATDVEVVRRAKALEQQQQQDRDREKDQEEGGQEGRQEHQLQNEHQRTVSCPPVEVAVAMSVWSEGVLQVR